MPFYKSHMRFTVEILDAKGRKGKFAVWAVIDDNSASSDDIESFCQQLAIQLDPLVTGQIIGVSGTVIAQLPSDGLKTAPLPTSDIEEGAMFFWGTGNGVRVHTRVPTFDEHLVTNPPPFSVVQFQELITKSIEVFNIYIDPTSSHWEPLINDDGYQESFKAK